MGLAQPSVLLSDQMCLETLRSVPKKKKKLVQKSPLIKFPWKYLITKIQISIIFFNNRKTLTINFKLIGQL